MKKLFILGVVLLGFGCQPSPADTNQTKIMDPSDLSVYGPDKDGVKCYQFRSYSSNNNLSCVYVGIEESK